jgi:hypothetical protein
VLGLDGRRLDLPDRPGDRAADRLCTSDLDDVVALASAAERDVEVIVV